MKPNNEFKRVVVTGYGAVTPLGATADESWQAMMDNRLGYRYVDKTAQNINTHFLGLVDNEPSLAGVPAVIRRRLPRFARLTVGAARQAMTMAFGVRPPQEYYCTLDCGVIMGTGWGGLDESYDAQSEFAARASLHRLTVFIRCPASPPQHAASSGDSMVTRIRWLPPARRGRSLLATLTR